MRHQESEVATTSDDRGFATGCPVLDGFDPLAPDQVGEPFGSLAQARQEAPVFYMPKYDLWCVTRMEDVLTVFKDTTTYSNSHEAVGQPPAEFADKIPDGHPVAHSLDALDPPGHTRIRRLAQKAFTPRHVGAREVEIRAICDELVDTFADRGSADLVGAFTTFIPVRVIATILGMDQKYAPLMKRWTDDWFAIWLGDDSAAVRRERWQRTVEFDKFIRSFVEDRRLTPRDDLTSDLVHATSDDGEPSLSTYEVICVIAGIVAAGSDTTSILLAHAVWLLLSEPERWEAVRRDRTLVPVVVEETLRLRNPVRGLRRITTRPVTLGGADIPAGAALYVHVGSANRDEEVFQNAEVFDVRRTNLSEHVGFGKWTHFCLGAPLARVEARVALECLVDRLPNLRLGAGQEHLDYTPNAVVPGVRHLEVIWD
jgi:cytochrome P450